MSYDLGLRCAICGSLITDDNPDGIGFGCRQNVVRPAEIAAAKELNPNLIIQLDGGVNFEVVKKTAKYVDNFISGSFLIKLENPKDFVETVKKI